MRTYFGYHEAISGIAAAMGCQYLVKGEPIPYEKVFSPTGLLPAIMRRADQLCSFCLGYGLGLILSVQILNIRSRCTNGYGNTASFKITLHYGCFT